MNQNIEKAMDKNSRAVKYNSNRISLESGNYRNLAYRSGLISPSSNANVNMPNSHLKMHEIRSMQQDFGEMAVMTDQT